MNLSKFNFESDYESVRNRCYKCYELDPFPNFRISLVWIFYTMYKDLISIDQVIYASNCENTGFKYPDSYGQMVGLPHTHGAT
jgi:hypothetical protein